MSQVDQSSLNNSASTYFDAAGNQVYFDIDVTNFENAISSHLDNGQFDDTLDAIIPGTSGAATAANGGDQVLLANNFQLRSNEDPLAGIYGTTTVDLGPGLGLEFYQAIGNIPGVINDALGGNFNPDSVPYPTAMLRIKLNKFYEFANMPQFVQKALDNWLQLAQGQNPKLARFASFDHFLTHFRATAASGNLAIVITVNSEDAIQLATAAARGELDTYRMETLEVRFAYTQRVPGGGLFWANVGWSVYPGLGENIPPAGTPYPPPDNGEPPLEPPALTPLFRMGYESPKLNFRGRNYRLGAGLTSQLESRPGVPTLQLADGRVVALPEEMGGVLDFFGILTQAGTSLDALERGVPPLAIDLTFEEFQQQLAYELTGGALGDANFPELSDSDIQNIRGFIDKAGEISEIVDTLSEEGLLSDTVRGAFLANPNKLTFRLAFYDWIINNVTADSASTIGNEKVGFSYNVLGINDEALTEANWSDDQRGLYREFAISAWDTYREGAITGEQYVNALVNALVETSNLNPNGNASILLRVENILQSANFRNVLLGDKTLLDDVNTSLAPIITNALLDRGVDPIQLTLGLIEVYNSDLRNGRLEQNATAVWNSPDPRMQIATAIVEELFGDISNNAWLEGNPYAISDLLTLGPKLDALYNSPGFDTDRFNRLAERLLELGYDMNFGSTELSKAVNMVRDAYNATHDIDWSAKDDIATVREFFSPATGGSVNIGSGVNYADIVGNDLSGYNVLVYGDEKATALTDLLYKAYAGSGLSDRRALEKAVEGYNEGGKALVAQYAVTVLNNSVPVNVSEQAFVDFGMDQQTAQLAEAIYKRLMAHPNEALSTREAWTVVWKYYLLGHKQSTSSGIANGGYTGALDALRALAYDLGLDANEFLPERLRSFSESEQLIASGDPNTLIALGDTALTPSQVFEQIEADTLSFRLEAELQRGGAHQNQIGPILDTVARILQQIPGKAAEIGGWIANGVTAYEAVQNLINGVFAGESGDITGFVTDQGRIIEGLAPGLQYQRIYDGSGIGYVGADGSVIPLSQPDETVTDIVLRGPDPIRLSLSSFAELAANGLFGDDLRSVGQIGQVAVQGFNTADRIAELSRALDLAVTAPLQNQAVIDQTRSMLNSEIAGAVGLGFDLLGIAGKNNPTLKTIADIGGTGVEIYQAIQSIEAASAALNAAKSANDSAQIAAASQQLATSIIGAVNIVFSVIGLVAGDNETLQDIAKFGGAATAVALAATSGTPLAIIGAMFAVMMLFTGGKPKSPEIADMDVTGDGSEDSVRFSRDDWDYQYDVNAHDNSLKLNGFTFRLDKATVEIGHNYDAGETYNSNIVADNPGQYESEEDYAAQTVERYFLSFDGDYASLFPGVTGDGNFSNQFHTEYDDGIRTIHDGIELTKLQYDQLMAAYGEEGTFGNDEAGLAAYEAFRPHLGGQTVWFSQEAAGEGLNFLMDVNGDGILDRVQQFMNLEEIDGPDYVGGPAFKVNLRNAAGEEYQRLEGNSFQDIIQAIAFQPYILSYIASHPDLIRSYGTDIMSAMPHFLANAEKLGITFDPASYLLANPDLVNAFGGDSVAAARHYIENGYDEGRATGLPDAATLAQQSAIQNDPGGVLSRLAVIAPSLWQITKTDLSAVTPGQVAETLNILMTISTATVPYILEAIAPGELYASAAADYSPPDASDLSGFQVVGDHIVSSQPSQTPASGELPDLSGLLSPGTSASTAMDGRLNSGEALLSANGRYAAVMRGDGNLVVYDYSTGHSIWQSGTNDAGSHLFMGSDGNLVIGRYVDAEFEKWSSGTGAAGVNRDFSLVMQDDGNLVVYDSQGNKGLWSSQGGLVAPAEAPFLLQTGTDYPETDGNSEFKFFDYNRDGRDDLVVIRKAGGAGTAEVHVYDGALNFAAPLLNTATMLPEADGTTEFEVADWNRDGRMDLVAIRKSGTGTGTTEVRVLDGATNFSTPLLETGTMLHEADDRFDFEVGDWNGDGRQDLFAIMKSQTGTGSTEVHIYDGATNFSSALLETGTGLGETNSDFEFDFADHNNDGRLDLVAVNRNEGGGTTELFVYDGTSNFATSLLQTGTVLGATDSRFEFEVTDWDRDGQADLAAIQKSGTGTGSSEVHILNGALGGGSAQSIAYDGPLILGDLIVNQELDAYQAIRSANGRYLALMQAAGNFVVYDQAENREIWASNTDGEAAGGRLVMQGDGNLVVYDAGGGAQWNSGSWGDGVSRDFSLVIQDDGNLVIYDSQGGEPLWSSVGGSVVRPETNA